MIYLDNIGAVLLYANIVLHSKIKHFELDLYFVRDVNQQKHLHLSHILTLFQVADILMKSLTRTSFQTFKDKLMVIQNPIISLSGDIKGFNNLGSALTLLHLS